MKFKLKKLNFDDKNKEDLKRSEFMKSQS